MAQQQNYLTVPAVQKIMLAILKDVVTYFDTHDYHYVLTGGSALGAVRHQGFIP
jgi:lipopolysaccharide cholinephosphotransferase